VTPDFEFLDAPNRIITIEQYTSLTRNPAARRVVMPNTASSGFIRYEGRIYRYMGRDIIDGEDLYIDVTESYHQDIPTRAGKVIPPAESEA
jgi:hypothetical protein